MHRRLIAHESIRLSLSKLKSLNFIRSTIVDEFHRRKMNIYKVKVRSASDLRPTVRKESTRNQWLIRIVGKEVARRKLQKPILEKWEGVSTICNPSAKRTVATT